MYWRYAFYDINRDTIYIPSLHSTMDWSFLNIKPTHPYWCVRVNHSHFTHIVYYPVYPWFLLSLVTPKTSCPTRRNFSSLYSTRSLQHIQNLFDFVLHWIPLFSRFNLLDSKSLTHRQIDTIFEVLPHMKLTIFFRLSLPITFQCS